MLEAVARSVHSSIAALCPSVGVSVANYPLASTLPPAKKLRYLDGEIELIPFTVLSERCKPEVYVRLGYAELKYSAKWY